MSYWIILYLTTTELAISAKLDRLIISLLQHKCYFSSSPSQYTCTSLAVEFTQRGQLQALLFYIGVFTLTGLGLY